ncbi:SDR family NAD(P)-dependent oxidoreductase [Piscicoccus intestinalis]|uniref:SDR family NAD(P)-dependent oxidoreductase n=1 Tax=Piscicoccus intestinalis TaxID=746033 RepID=UPI0008392E4E|nr:SDR family NAD(P)-dependent oxidoreductase [Piscicoccus intestinalis]
MSDRAARVIVMTGATSGIGAQALERLAREPGNRMLLGARGTGRAVPAGVQTVPLDLASLTSVREFAQDVVRNLARARIDVLVLNAAVQARHLDGRTADGFESTFGVNHLAHYLLVRLLLPYLSDGGRIVITTSDTHDPAIIPFGPRHLDPAALAHPAERGAVAAGMRAYAASKLCNLLTARSLAARDEVRARRIQVVAYNPGLTGGTNLMQLSTRAQRAASAVIRPALTIIGRFRPAFAMGTPERAGEVLAQLATGEIAPPPESVYVSLVRGEVTFPEPSALARDDATRDDLWRRSQELVGPLAP